MSDDSAGACAASRARSAAVRITLVTTDGARLGAKLLHQGAPHVTVDRCPRCGVEPGLVRGGARTHDHDTYRAPATALCCSAAVGTLKVRVYDARSRRRARPAAPLELGPVTTGGGWELRHGRWEDVLAPGARTPRAVIADPPFSARTHESRIDRADGSDPAGSTPSYAPWTPDHVHAWVRAWSPHVDGWMVAITDDILAPAFRAAYREADRVDFAPVGIVVRGMTVRVRGDGPSSWMLYALVARPRGGGWEDWGTLPGAYTGPAGDEAGGGRGKPDWLMSALVRDYSRPGDLIADPFAGWGSTLAAAAANGRTAIGAEQDRDAYAEAVRRLRRPTQCDLLTAVERR